MNRYILLCSIIILLLLSEANAQNVGVNTQTPDAPFHLGSSGQVNFPGGLFLLGNRSEGHMKQDFNLIQSLYGANPLALALQPEGGKLGIGITNPLTKVHVYGSEDELLTMHSSDWITNKEVGVQFLLGTDFLGIDWNNVNDGGVLKFLDGFDNFSTSGQENLRIENNGYVGIGTDDPQTKLHVDGGPQVSETGQGDFQVGSPVNLHLRFDENDIAAKNGNNPATLNIQQYGGNISMGLDVSSRVSIGPTFIPQSKLHIAGGADVNLVHGGELILGSILEPNLAMDGNEIQARDNNLASPLYLQQGGGDIVMLPGENGQVGIGINNVNNFPSDNYLLAVDGRILAEEVRVELSGDWPDYVFQPSYNLRSLEEVEACIKTKGHLPGIPSAMKVESEGIELGDMQKTMMEKIEELTLYLIEANKSIKTLEAQVESLKK